MFAKVILKSTCGATSVAPLTTMHLRFPRFLLAELNTHRNLSRSSRSSRAVPVQKMIDEVNDDPVIPWHWTTNKPGMQGGPNLEDDSEAVAVWTMARDMALDAASELVELGLHKQIVNRLLEPFMWVDTLVTSTEWDNFFHLRDHPDAEPHFQDLARMMKKALDEAPVQDLEPGEWHMPYITDEDREALSQEDLLKVSSARCARISYAPFDGDGSYEKELARFEKLAGDPPHSSAFEHIAYPDTFDAPYGDWAEPERHRNFNVWCQYRSFIPNDTFVPL